jgi:hypothetical protein
MIGNWDALNLISLDIQIKSADGNLAGVPETKEYCIDTLKQQLSKLYPGKEMAIQDPQTYKDQFQVARETYLKQVRENPRRAVETLECARKVVTTYNKLNISSQRVQDVVVDRTTSPEAGVQSVDV